MTLVTTIVTCMTDSERPYLAQALRSVQGQTTPSRIVLCVEQGNTWVGEVLDNLEVGIDVVRVPLAPPGVVRNGAMETVTTKYVALLDADDVWRPDKLRRQLLLLEDKRLDVVASRHLLIREDGKPYFFGFANSVPMQSSWVGRTEAFRARPYEPMAIGEDVQLWRRIQDDLRWAVLPGYLLRYRVRQSSQSSMTWSKERKLRYARRSQNLGMRWLLLATSYAAGLGVRIQNGLVSKSRGRND